MLEKQIYPTRHGLEPTDYYLKEQSRDLKIQIWLHDNPDNIDKIWVTCSGDSNFEAKYSYRNSPTSYYLSNAVREKFALVYLDASRNFDNYFSSSQWSIFGRIARNLHADFVNSVPNETQQAVRGHLDQAQELLKTPLYRQFETSVAEAFQDQIRRTTHQVQFDFRTFDPLNFYKTLHPILIEGEEYKNPKEAGSGMRNLIVMALFRAYAKAFRGNAVIAIEEPEIYMHPHAQRSLSTLFEEMANAGNQVFYSTHSATFTNIARADRIVLVKRCPDEEEEVCTQIRWVTGEDLLAERQRLHPNIPMTIDSMRERYRNICGIEHAEAFFARAIVLVEGPTEKEALPIYALHQGVDFDALGISVVSANGKGNLDQLFQLYRALGFPVFMIFDNDQGGEVADIRLNKVLTRLLGLPEEEMPAAATSDQYCIIERTFEVALEGELEVIQTGLYASLKADAVTYLGRGAGKALIARYIAYKLIEQGTIPPTIREVVEKVSMLRNLIP